jgi:hypothetical protein
MKILQIYLIEKSAKLIQEERLLPEVYFSRVDGLGVDPATLAVDISKTFYLGTQILGEKLPHPDLRDKTTRIK